jgi:O-antigen/teichoic acid export membrane protein
VGLVVVRGAAIRTGGYALGVGLSALSSVFMLRYLSVADFGRYMTVASLIAIVASTADAGLTTVGIREMAHRTRQGERTRLISNLLGLRLALGTIGVVGAIAFSVAVGYESTLVLGALLMGIGLLLTTAQLTMALPFYAELAIGRQTTAETVRQVATVAGIVVLVVAQASLLPFFGVQILAGLATIVVMPWLIGSAPLVWRPSFDRAVWGTLVRLTLPLALSTVITVLYFRLLILLMSLLSDDVQTGLFATSFRVIELLYGVVSVAVAVALPVLTATANDRERLQYMLQRMTEAGLLVACYLSLTVFAVAEPVLRLIGGPEYVAAATVLRIQVFALIPVFVAQVWLTGLIAIGRNTALAIASGVGIVVAGGLGASLIEADGARGAAIAALAGETALAAVVLLLLRSHRAYRLNGRFLGKIAGASAAAITAVAALGSMPWLAVSVATAAYGGVVLLTHAVPPEIWDAFRRLGERGHPQS